MCRNLARWRIVDLQCSKILTMLLCNFVSFASFAPFFIPLYLLMCPIFFLILGLGLQIWIYSMDLVPWIILCAAVTDLLWYVTSVSKPIYNPRCVREREIFYVQGHWISQEWRIRWKLKPHHLLDFKTLRISKETYSICISSVYNFPYQNVMLLSSEVPRISAKPFKVF